MRRVRPSRRVIISSDVAETGLTLPTLGYVVDGGWMRKPEFIFGLEAWGLLTRPAPRANATQRRGRAGRLFPGEAYPLYTEDVFDVLPAETQPAVVTDPLQGSILDLVAAQTIPGPEYDLDALEAIPTDMNEYPGVPTFATSFRVKNIDMLTAPPPMALWSGLSSGIVAGLLAPGRAEDDTVGLQLTPAATRLYALEPSLSPELWCLALMAPSCRLRPIDLVTGALSAELLAPLWGARLPPPGVFKPRVVPPPPDQILKTLPAPMALLMGARTTAGELSARQLIGSEPAEAVLAMDAFADAAAATGDSHARLLEWCETAGLNYDGLIQLATLREAACSALLNLGLDPFWGDEHRLAQGAATAGPARAPDEQAIGRVRERFRRFRSAFSDAWRERLLWWDAPAGAYRPAGTAASQGRAKRPKDIATPHVKLMGADGPLDPKVWAGSPPRWAVAGTLTIVAKKSRASREAVHDYEIVAKAVSTLDGSPDDFLYAYAAEGSDSGPVDGVSIEAFRIFAGK